MEARAHTHSIGVCFTAGAGVVAVIGAAKVVFLFYAMVVSGPPIHYAVNNIGHLRCSASCTPWAKVREAEELETSRSEFCVYTSRPR